MEGNLAESRKQDWEQSDGFPNDYETLTAFYDANKSVFKTIHSLRWEVRFRATNGLLEDGVVVERRPDPNASRPQLLISPSRYFARLRGRGNMR